MRSVSSQLRVACLVVLLAWVTSAPAVAATDLIVTHPGLDLSGNDVEAIYRGLKRFVGASRLKPVDNLSARSEFLKRKMGMNETSYHVYWEKLTFQEGIPQPILVRSDKEVIEYVASNQGAIGYLKNAPPPETRAKVKVLEEF